MGITDSAFKLLIEKGLPKNRDRLVTLGVPRMPNKDLEWFKPFLGTKPKSHYYTDIFKELGFKEFVSIDVSDYEHCDVVHDLNEPFDKDIGQFDLLLDPGTLEHCFNIGQVFKTITQLVNINGKVFHNNPVNWIDHGFHNVSPCFYYDGYGQNGFDIELYIRDVKTSSIEHYPFTPQRTKTVNQDKKIWHCIATKKEEKPFTYPIQTRFTKIHNK